MVCSSACPFFGLPNLLACAPEDLDHHNKLIFPTGQLLGFGSSGVSLDDFEIGELAF